MKIYNVIRFKPTKELFLVIGLMIFCWIFNFIADISRGTYWFYLLYEGVFALGVCISLPMIFTTIKMKRPISTIGIKTSNWKKALLIGIAISSFAFFGRMMGMEIEISSNEHFISIIICMMFSTLFEEVFFRGFLQSRFEDFFGIVPAILLSGICFALYHSAQSFIGFDLQQLISLFFVGLVFSISYQLTRNIITSYIVNLPQAILTFMGDSEFIEYGKNINSVSAIVCSISILVAIYLIIYFNKRYQLYRNIN